MRLYVCLCVCMCVCARARGCVRVSVSSFLLGSISLSLRLQNLALFSSYVSPLALLQLTSLQSLTVSESKRCRLVFECIPIRNVVICLSSTLFYVDTCQGVCVGCCKHTTQTHTPHTHTTHTTHTHTHTHTPTLGVDRVLTRRESATCKLQI